METLNLSFSMQEVPVDLSVNKAKTETPMQNLIPTSTMTIPDPNFYPPHVYNLEKLIKPKLHSITHSSNVSASNSYEANLKEMQSINNFDNTNSKLKENKLLVDNASCVKKPANANDANNDNSTICIPVNVKSKNENLSLKRKHVDEDYIKFTPNRKRHRLRGPKEEDLSNLQKAHNQDYAYNCLSMNADSIPVVDPLYSTLHYLQNSQNNSQDPESLLAAVQHSQMLYYSYCNQLLQSLQSRKSGMEVANNYPRRRSSLEIFKTDPKKTIYLKKHRGQSDEV